MKFFLFYLFLFLYVSSSAQVATSTEVEAASLVTAIDGFNKGPQSCSISSSSGVLGWFSELFSGAPQKASTKEASIKSDLCSTLNKYATLAIANEVITLKIDKDKNICDKVWREEKSVEINKPNVKTKRDIPCIPPSRQQMLANGYTLATEDQKQELVESLKSQIKPFSELCCRDNSDCKKALDKIEIKFCHDFEADQNAQLPDSCIESTLPYYEVPSIEAINNNAKKSTTPLAGAIVLSSLFKKDNLKTIRNLTHELGHACSAIQRQIAILQKEDSDGEMASTFSQIELVEQGIKNRKKTSTECEINKKGQLAYQKLFTKITESEKFAACVFDMVQSFTVPTSSSYINDACAIKQIEEITAETLSLNFLIQNKEIIPKFFPNTVCGSGISTMHPRNSQLTKCLLLSSPGLVAQMRSALACECTK